MAACRCVQSFLGRVASRIARIKLIPKAIVYLIYRWAWRSRSVLGRRISYFRVKRECFSITQLELKASYGDAECADILKSRNEEIARLAKWKEERAEEQRRRRLQKSLFSTAFVGSIIAAAVAVCTGMRKSKQRR